MFQFTYHGGSRKSSEHSIEKFMLFFVVGGKEMTFYDMKKLGYVESTEVQHSYVTDYKHLKIFISEQGFGIRKRYLSFYFELSSAGNKIKIMPFLKQVSPFMFEGIGRFLRRKEIRELVTDEHSLYFYENQPKLPKNILLELVEIDKTHMKKDMRKITILKKE